MSFRGCLFLAVMSTTISAAGPAAATATLVCTINDRALGFDLQVTVGHEALTLSGVRGELRLKREAVTISLDGVDPMQTWIDGDDLRLRFHVFTEADRPEIDLAVVTRRRNEIDYAGRYRLTVGSDGTARRGTVTCSLG